jgi:hypothetical protein
VDPELCLVTVYSKTRGIEHYGVGSDIPVWLVGSEIAVVDIFVES